MHDMTAKKEALLAYTPHPNFAKWHKQFPTTAWMRRKAPHNVPRFAFEYGDTGAGNDVGIAHNWAAFDAIKVSPRYGKVISPPPAEVELFGTRYSAPIGIAPMGAPSLVWPGADVLMAQGRAARARALRAQHRRRPHHRGGGQACAGRVLAAALPFLARRPQNRLRPDAARRGRRSQGAGAHARRAGAHHALARNLCRPRRRVPPERAHDLRDAGAAEMAAGVHAQRLSALCHARRIRQVEQHQRHHPLCPRQYGRRLHLGRGQALSRRLEGQDGGQGRAASGRRREGGGARHRRHLGVEPRRPPDRGAHALDRRAAGDRCGRRQEGDRRYSTAACARART